MEESSDEEPLLRPGEDQERENLLGNGRGKI